MIVGRICILKMEGGRITGWIIAADIRDACQQASANGEKYLAVRLFAEESPRPGKYDLGQGYTMLVS